MNRRKKWEKAHCALSDQSAAFQVLVNEDVCEEKDGSNLVDDLQLSSSRSLASFTLPSSTLTMDDNNALTPEQSSL